MGFRILFKFYGEMGFKVFLKFRVEFNMGSKVFIKFKSEFNVVLEVVVIDDEENFRVRLIVYVRKDSKFMR